MNDKLREFFSENKKIALAYSGGVDSAYLLAAAIEAGADVTAYMVCTPFQPAFEIEDAKKTAESLGANLKVLQADTLANEEIVQNKEDRCYHCKNKIFLKIFETLGTLGDSLIVDGTNFSDDASDRPGMRALKELGVRSPLRECGIDKAEVRSSARELGLSCWNKPSYSCLATRIAAGERITEERLAEIECSESFLKGLGFTDFRVRTYELTEGKRSAKLEIRADEKGIFAEHKDEILDRLGQVYTDIKVSEDRA
ncbi:MAG: ATP-dependent sacrificial sulfur transferase LarE [Mogibacterium sp.]|nr:ATP-dependent sacrificial sulfur transferase LarE [Mogibacterium sp.]